MEGNDWNGEKKKFDIFTIHSPPKRGRSGFQKLLLSLLFFFKCRNTEGKVQIDTHQQQLISKASSEKSSEKQEPFGALGAVTFQSP